MNCFHRIDAWEKKYLGILFRFLHKKKPVDFTNLISCAITFVPYILSEHVCTLYELVTAGSGVTVRIWDPLHVYPFMPLWMPLL